MQPQQVAQDYTNLINHLGKFGVQVGGSPPNHVYFSSYLFLLLGSRGWAVRWHLAYLASTEPRLCYVIFSIEVRS